jgi:hypothetical protein
MRTAFLRAALLLLLAASHTSMAQGVVRAAGDPARAQALGSRYGLTQQRVLGLRQQFMMSWEDIETALHIAAGLARSEDPPIAMDSALNRVLELRAMGQEWNSIAQQFNVSPVADGGRTGGVRRLSRKEVMTSPRVQTQAWESVEEANRTTQRLPLKNRK